MVELIARFDSVMKEHTRRIWCEEIHDHYLSKTIQNELIDIMGSKVRETIITWINKAKYYAIILDCTPDVSHQEQFSLTIRFVKMGSFPETPVTIQEHFVTFLLVDETTGKELTAVLLKELDTLGLKVKNIRGQGYDNGANMKGHKSGLQSRILQHNPRAFFTPCACHSLNLLLGDIAKSCVKGTSFFGVLSRLYVFLSGSTKRWSIFKKHVSGLTVKPLCETRWESRIESVVVIRYQAAEILSALLDMADNLNDPGACSEAESLADAIQEISFLVSVVFWYDTLHRVNKISKTLQKEDADLNIAVDMLDGVIRWLKKYRQTGFSSAIIDAKEIAEELGVDPVFKSTRIRARKRQFGETPDEALTDPTEIFRVQCYNVIVDRAIVSMNERFQQLKTHYARFGVVLQFSKHSRSEVIKQCRKLETSLRDGEDCDIDGLILADELDGLKSLLPSVATKKPHQLLQYMHKNKLTDVFPNTCIVFRILLTIPVTVASGERSFSKLKLIKTYLRSTMTQERLSSLAVLLIEQEVAKTLDYSSLIDSFASAKARKVNL